MEPPGPALPERLRVHPPQVAAAGRRLPTKDLPEIVDGLPNLSGSKALIERAITRAREQAVFLPDSRIDFDRIRSACAVALHRHQPLTPSGGDDLPTVRLIGNLQYITEHTDFGDTHDALLHLLTSQTSCYRYWGPGLWTDYGCEVCRRANEIQAHDY